jgi:prepilin signal peptidase PulO-like enzyme (type II secretory pathway)
VSGALGAIAVFAGVFGLVIGSFLNVVVARVPARVSLLRESRCPGCDSPVRPWQNVPVLSWLALRGRCASCRMPISARYPLVEAATGGVFAGIAVWWVLGARVLDGGVMAGASPRLTDAGAVLSAVAGGSAVTGPLSAQLCVLAAYLCFAASGITLALIDLDVRRLPNAITGTAFGACLALLAAAVLLGADGWALMRAGLGALALWAFYALLRAVRPDGMGGGDVRLALVTGLVLGWLGWGPLVVGAFAAFALGGVFGLALIARGAGRRTAIPFGPWIIVGAWAGLLAGDVVTRTYLSAIGVA